jgi:glycosyltransferase involved in cell wall biosynthesis
MLQGFRRSLAAIGPDVVAINGYSAKDAQSLLGWCRLYRRPAILMFDSKFDDAPRTWWKERIKRLIVSQFSAALCAGTLHQAYLELLGMASEQIFWGYDVVDNEYFGKSVEQVRANRSAFRHLPGLRSEAPFFLASSRFIRRKNLQGLLLAYERYRRQSRVDQVIPWRLVVLGDGEERENLAQLIADKEIEGITLAGFRQIEDLPAYYGLAGAFIHPALQEQWGLVVNEAMASGLPVLVSERCGCVPDLVRQGENGFTFDPDDTVALANLMSRFSSGEVDLMAMGETARRHIRQWGPDRFVLGLQGALQVVLRKRGPSSEPRHAV